jgi:hypothetical protein
MTAHDTRAGAAPLPLPPFETCPTWADFFSASLTPLGDMLCALLDRQLGVVNSSPNCS